MGNRAAIEENGRRRQERREGERKCERVSMHVKDEEQNEEKLKRTELRVHRWSGTR